MIETLKKWSRGLSRKNNAIQRAMWDTMQRNGYFRFHTVYKGWQPEAENPCLVQNNNLSPKTLSGFLEGLDLSSDELIIDLPGDPVETFNTEVVPALIETEEVWLQKIVPLGQEMIVLDIGCGYGRTEEWMHNYVREIHGVDISTCVIEICRERFKQINNAHFYHNNGTSLSMFNASTFDFIYCFTVFQHIPRQFVDAYLREIKRVLKPGGLCMFNVLSGMNYDLHDGAYGTEWAIGYRREDMEEKIHNSGLLPQRILTWKIKGMVPYWHWFIVKK